ncbi:hypothetical protein EYM_06030 [Ignicoccus islandicus DSM 13165]|uniref:Solute-binding protein family 5 domain-containing protein n=1 Tax=Ignicoccus islandicus DSM 13165 TaxID=940295 RepID=A0A0U3FLE7_9CREN|nr:hypothetical protein EYM_06030 [Ignicoccus islandicus DSM 13165]
MSSQISIGLGNWGPPNPVRFYPRGPAYVITSFAYDTLVWKDSKGVIPWLAVKWVKLNDTAWVFYLRKGLTWSDGEPLTAEDVAFSYNYLKESKWAWKDMSVLKRAVALNETTVLIELNRPFPLFVEEYATTVFVIPKRVWSSKPSLSVSSGPYVLKSYSPGSGYVFVKNPRFWGPEPLFDQLVIPSMQFTSPQALASAFISGKVDAITLMGKAWRLIKVIESRKPNAIIKKGPMYWVLFLGFNLNKYPFDVKEFRKAVSLALDLKQLVLRSVGSFEGALPGVPGYVPPYSAFYNKNVGVHEYSPKEAVQLMEKLGIRDSDGDGCVELNGRKWRPLLVTSKSWVTEALIVKEMLERVGICVNVKTVAGTKQLDWIVKNGAFDMEINGHGATGNNPFALTWIFKAFGTPWFNEKYEKLMRKLTSAKNLEEAEEIAKEAQGIIADEVPRIALYYPYQFLVSDGKAHWFFTYNGIDGGIPLPYNKLALLKPIR